MHRLADDVVAAEGEAEVRDATRGADAGAAFLDPGQALEERARIVVVLLDPGRDREHVRVEHDVLGPEADLADEQVVGAAADRHAPLDLGGLALLVERHHDDARPVVADAARMVQELVLAFLERDRVDDALPLQALQAGLDHGPFRAVDHHRQARDLRLGGDHVQEGPHRLLPFEQIRVHVHVDQVCATANLLERDVDRGVEVVGFDQAAEARGAGHVRALADQHETGVLPDLERLEAAEPRRAPCPRDRTRLEAPHRRRDRLRVLGRRPATGSRDVEEAVARELVQQRRRDVRRLVVAAERVRQAGVRMRRGEAGCDPRELGDVRPHLTGPERAVDADDQRLGVLDRRPEAVDRLPAECSAREIDDRDADPERQLRGDLARGDQRRLRVQRVEDRLDQQQVDAAVGEPANLLGVGLDDLVEGVRPVTGIVDARAQRERDVQRADRAGDEPVRPGGSPGDARAGDVQVVDRILEPVVGLADGRRRERVGRGDVGAGGEVRVVHRTNDLRLRQVQQVGIVEQVARMIREALTPEIGLLEPTVLQQHAPGAVEHEDALLGEASDLVGDVAVGHELFRRLVTRSPSCFSKLSGTWILANGVRHQGAGRRAQERPATASWFSA